MREKPILFSTPMVKAILDGKKTMTRRVVRPQPNYLEEIDLFKSRLVLQNKNCPYKTGMKLWVRETWAGGVDFGTIIYKADGTELPPYNSARWYPSIHMYRRDSRITLEITNVQVERLQEITEKDIIKEGAVLRSHDDDFGHNPLSAFDGKVYLDLMSLWAFGWDKINGKTHPWASNPWVYVIEFKRAEDKG